MAASHGVQHPFAGKHPNSPRVRGRGICNGSFASADARPSIAKPCPRCHTNGPAGRGLKKQNQKTMAPAKSPNNRLASSADLKRDQRGLRTDGGVSPEALSGRQVATRERRWQAHMARVSRSAALATAGAPTGARRLGLWGEARRTAQSPFWT
jgi:hypothetical protein